MRIPAAHMPWLPPLGLIAGRLCLRTMRTMQTLVAGIPGRPSLPDRGLAWSPNGSCGIRKMRILRTMRDLKTLGYGALPARVEPIEVRPY